MVDDTNAWNFRTFEKHIDQRFADLSLHLRERYETQQNSISTALTAAEKTLNAAMIAAEKAVNKAEAAQNIRNEAQNEFRKALSDLSGLMWTTKEGVAAVDALRREIDIVQDTIQARIRVVENGYANIQGRIWAVSALFGVASAVVAATVSRLLSAV